MAPGTPAYPVRVEGHLEEPSRWLWLVKWLLALPHFVVLGFLWLAFAVLSVGAFFALLFGGRYPRGIFDFNLGVLRWTWRVCFYAFAANGTDRYPPFTMADVPDYPARLVIAYPDDQRHGLRLIGWWLAGVPQYVVAGVFGGGAMLAWQAGRVGIAWPGLIFLLVLTSVLVLLVHGAMPRSIFDFVLGLNRWVIRVTAYATLMTREYPPFRVDAGEHEPGGLALAPATALPFGQTGARASTEPVRWSGGRVVAVVLGSLVVVSAVGLLAAGTAVTVVDQAGRDADGFAMVSGRTFTSPTYAVVSERLDLTGPGDRVARTALGLVRLRSTSATPVFIGIGPAAAVDLYLAGVERETARDVDAHPGNLRTVGGGAPATAPGDQGFWVAQTAGAGRQQLTWRPSDGVWRAVLMNADGSAGIRARVAAGAQLPHLLAIGVGLLGAGALLLLLGGLVVAAAVPRTREP